jgi:hypothetical protein
MRVERGWVIVISFEGVLYEACVLATHILAFIPFVALSVKYEVCPWARCLRFWCLFAF